MARTPRMQLLLPIVWAVGCAVGFANPGDEYGLFALGSILGTWTLLVSDQGIALALPLVVGCALMFGAGRLLQSLRGSRDVWLVTWILAAVLTYGLSVAQFESMERAISKNGSIGAYVAFASQVGSYVATVLTLAVAAVRTWFGDREDPASSVVGGTTGA